MIEQGKKALVFDLQKYSLHDGPGIRTLVFLKGCILRCQWCCNPESQLPKQEVEFHKDLCINCGKCADVCARNAIRNDTSDKYKIDKSTCINCGSCAEACPADALRIIGKWATASEIMSEIIKDAKFYRKSGGGVTLSGGEPLVWIDFCEELLRYCYNYNIHTAIETTGCIPENSIDRVKDYVDVFLYDIKCMDSNRHKELTGMPNDLILSNIRRLREDGKNVVMRIPLIPEKNFLKDELEKMFAFADELGLEEVNIMPYHNLGQIKYDRLCKPYELSDLESLKFAKDFDEQMEQFKYIFDRHKNIRVMIGG